MFMAAPTAILGTMTTLGATLPSASAFPWLTVITFGPLIGILALMLIPREQTDLIRNTALLCTIGVFLVSLGVLVHFDPSVVAETGQIFAFQMTDGPVEWIPALGIHYYLGVDGISLWLVLLTTFLGPIVVYSTYSSVDEHVKEYMICLLFLQIGMVGALVSLDVFLFYIFWEMMLIPMYLIIGVWGADQRIYAAVKFFIYTMIGSLLMLIGILYVYFQTGAGGGAYSFLFTQMAAVELGYNEQFWLFAAFFLAFAIKVPLVPFHTWLPRAHVQAPTAGSVILAGVLLKMGTYGMLRYAFPLFPDALKTFAPYVAVLATIGVVYGALMAMVQDNVKSLVAYSSISHLGFCVLGLVSMTPQGLAGGMYVMLAHGISTGGLFLAVGILYERRHTKKIEDFGGLAKSMPVFAAMFMIVVFASAGLPGLNGFVGEFLSLIGTAKSHFLWFEQPLVFAPDWFFELSGPATEAENIRKALEQSSGQGFKLGASPLGLPLTPPEDLPAALQSKLVMQAGPEMTAYLFALVAATGVIWAAGYLLWMWRRVMFGPIDQEENREIADLNVREVLYMLPIVFMAIFMGVFPQFFLSRMEPSLHGFLRHMKTEVEQEAPKNPGTVVVEESDPSWVPDKPLLDENAENDTRGD